jgi:multidrug efflux pump
VYGGKSTWARLTRGYDINVPQLRQRGPHASQTDGINLADIYDTMQVNLDSLYVNDFTRFGKTYQVVVQAIRLFRADAAAITNLPTRNGAGEMVPLGVDEGRTDFHLTAIAIQRFPSPISTAGT